MKRVLGCCHDLILAPRSRQVSRTGRGNEPHCHPLHWQTGATRPTSAPRRAPKGPALQLILPKQFLTPQPAHVRTYELPACQAKAELWALRMVSRTAGRADPLIVFPLLSSSFPFPGSSEPYKSLGTPPNSPPLCSDPNALSLALLSFSPLFFSIPRANLNRIKILNSWLN